MYWIYELCYSCFRVTRGPRDAEDLAILPFGIIVFLPVISLLVISGVNIFPFENDTANVLMGFAYILLPMLAGNYILVKPFGYRKRVRARGVVIREYGWGRKIFNFLLFLVLFASFTWIPALVIQILKLMM